jgi:signal transduction histidine kinase
VILNRIKELLAPPVFPGDEDRSNRAAQLTAILYTVIVLGVLGSGAVLLSGGGGQDTVIFAALSVLVAVGCLALLRRGYVALASAVILIVLWGLFTVIVALAGGVRVTTFSFFGVLSLIGGFLLGFWGILVSVLAAVLTGLGLYLAEQHGLLPPIVINSLTAWIANSVFIIFQGMLLYLGLRTLDSVLKRWQSELFERRRVQEALHLSEERFRRVIDSVPIGIYLFDLDEQDRLVLRMVNPASMLGLQSDLQALPGKTAQDLFAHIGDPGLLEAFSRVARGGEPYRAEWIITSDGAVSQAVEIHLFSAGPRSAAAAFVDITQHKQSEAEREKLIRELEVKNAELERFTYTVSHDLKSPLITIRGFLGFIARDAQNGNLDRLSGDLKRVTEATGKMQSLLDDLLELSRIGRIINPPQAVPFASILREAMELVAGQIASSGAHISIQPDLPMVAGDRPRLVEVLQNLLDNGLKFMGSQPEPRIEVGTQPSQQPGWGLFFVRDNGQGIEPRFHETVFGLFNKLDARSEGTGVGLALVRRIVDVHGGKIWVESDGEGRGATFYFTLPLSEERED